MYFEVGFVYLAVHTALRLGFVVGRICRARSEWLARLQNSPLSAFSGQVSGGGADIGLCRLKGGNFEA